MPVTRVWLCAGGSVLPAVDGPVAVEAAAPGVRLRLRGGGFAQAAWIGRQRLSAEEAAARPAVWPVRVAAGALADGWPAAETPVLPDQALEVPGFAPVAAKWLVDGLGLRRPAPAGPLEVFSIVVEEAGVPEALCMAPGAVAARPDDAALFALRRHLAGRAGWRPGPLGGRIDRVGPEGVSGWAAEGRAAGRAVAIEVVVDGEASPPLVAEGFRADLAGAGIGAGRHGFRVGFAPALARGRRHLVRVRRAVDGADLAGSPALLDGAVRDVAALLAQDGPAGEMRRAAEAAARGLAARLAG